MRSAPRASTPPRSPRGLAGLASAVDSPCLVVNARAVSTQGPIIVNPAHWLDGDLIPAEPPALRAKALRVAQAIESGGPLARGLSRETLIPCTKHLDGAACPGLMVANGRDPAADRTDLAAADLAGLLLPRAGVVDVAPVAEIEQLRRARVAGELDAERVEAWQRALATDSISRTPGQH